MRLEERIVREDAARASLKAQMYRDAEIVAAQHDRIAYLEKELGCTREEWTIKDVELEEWKTTCEELEEKVSKGEEAVVHIRQVFNIVQDELASKNRNVEKIQEQLKVAQRQNLLSMTTTMTTMKENKCKVLDDEQIQRQQRRHDDKEEAYKFCSKDLKRRNSPDTTVTDQDRRGRKSSNPIRRWTDKSSSSTTTTTAVPAANIGPTGIAVDGENNTSTTIQSGRQIQTVLPEKKRSTQDITLRIQKAEGKAPPPKKH